MSKISAVAMIVRVMVLPVAKTALPSGSERHSQMRRRIPRRAIAIKTRSVAINPPIPSVKIPCTTDGNEGAEVLP